MKGAANGEDPPILRLHCVQTASFAIVHAPTPFTLTLAVDEDETSGKRAQIECWHTQLPDRKEKRFVLLSLWHLSK